MSKTFSRCWRLRNGEGTKTRAGVAGVRPISCESLAQKTRRWLPSSFETLAGARVSRISIFLGCLFFFFPFSASYKGWMGLL